MVKKWIGSLLKRRGSSKKLKVKRELTSSSSKRDNLKESKTKGSSSSLVNKKGSDASAGQQQEAKSVAATSPSTSTKDIEVKQRQNDGVSDEVVKESSPVECPAGEGNTTTVDRGGDSSAEEGQEEPQSFRSYASGASSVADDEEGYSTHSSERSNNSRSGKDSMRKNRSDKNLRRNSTSAIGLDEMIEDRREVGDLTQNVVHFEVPFGKPIEEVYDGVHTGPVLGSGISGMVRLVTHRATGLKYAVKVLDLGLVDTAETMEQLREEIYIMCQLDHPNIVRLEEVYESTSEIYLVQELCLGGELFDRLDEQPDYHYTEAECARLVKQMLCAVRYLHSRGIIHRDLKLENFLFSSTAKDSELKMIDFGLSKHFRYGEVQREAVGTPYTVAPEVIRGCYDERCDIWAIGVITFLLLSGDPPFGGCGGPEPLMTVRSNILRGAFYFQPESVWSNVSQQARLFIRSLLVTDPNTRPTARQTQRHKWMQEWACRDRKADDNVLSPNVVKALVNFKEFSDMRKLLCEVLSFTLLPDQIKELRREFEKMDTDGSGEISLNALKQVLMTNAGAGSLGALTEDEVEDIFNAMRVRKTETTIHWHEFIAAGLSQCQVDDRNLRLAFDRLDSDHKGYIILEDIMDLMGSDAIQSEEAMRRMWGDSIKAVKCQHARIAYEDFLLLMKGQTKDGGDCDCDDPATEGVLSASDKKELRASSHSHQSLTPSVLLEDQEEDDEELKGTGNATIIDVPPSATIVYGANKSDPVLERSMLSDGFDESESSVSTEKSDPKSLPQTPIVNGAENLRASVGSITPLPVVEEGKHVDEDVIGLPTDLITERTELVAEKPDKYTIRRRSRSFDQDDQYNFIRPKEHVENDMLCLNTVADAMRERLIPRMDSNPDINDESKSALVVNRKLYRAHRQMRLAVLEASKRFEEQQAAHAKEVILSQREAEDANSNVVPAGLVMRRGHKGQVSSEQVKCLLRKEASQQQVLVEKATKRGGRGKRSRKKTISDMSGMLQSSLTQDEMGAVAIRASSQEKLIPPPIEESKALDNNALDNNALDNNALDNNALDNNTVLSQQETGVSEETAPTEDEDAQIRRATIPGNFLQTKDPFGKQGMYGGATPTTTCQ